MSDRSHRPGRGDRRYGCAGPTGPAGTSGQTGPAGISDYQVVNNIAVGTLEVAHCPTGLIALGGGGLIDSGTMSENGPHLSSDGTKADGWVVQVNGANSPTLAVYAICARLDSN